MWERQDADYTCKISSNFEGFAIDLGSVEMNSKVLGDLVVPLLV